jgi:DNA polymerase-3 subunit delta'
MDAFRKLAAANPCFTESELYNALGIEGRNSMIAVAEAKHLLETLSLSALEGGYRSVLIYLPEKMNVDAANRLLKMIEEPPQMTQFLLVTHSPEKVLATISSRCQHIRISPVSEHRDVKYADSGLFEEYIESLLSKNLLSCLEVSEKISALPSRESAKAFCKFAAGSLREIFIAQQRLAGLGQVSAQASGWAARCPKSFPRLAMAVVDRAQMLIDRNVNLKIIFADMTDRLFLLL